MKKVEAYFVISGKIFFGIVAIGVLLFTIGLVMLLLGYHEYGIIMMLSSVLITMIVEILTIIIIGKVELKIELE